MNFTSDNVSVNDKTMRELELLLRTRDGVEFDGRARRSK